MSSQNVTEARHKRLNATRAAAHIGLMSRKTGVSVEDVSWELLSELPPWCLADNSDRQAVQRICGALYFSPQIRTSIDGSLLRRFSGFVGDPVFNAVRSANGFTHTVRDQLNMSKLEVQVMASGSSVLLGTLVDATLVQLYTEIAGPPGDHIESDLASEIYSTATQLAEAE